MANKITRPVLKCKNCNIDFQSIAVASKGYCSNKCWLNFKHTNKIATNRGFKHSEETKKQLSIIKIGKKHPSVSISNAQRKGIKHPMFGKLKPDMTGKNNPNWKGGISTNRRMDGELKKWRLRIFERDNYTCQICDITGGYLHADHIKKYADYPELRYDVDNGRTLCVACHYYVTYKKKMPKGIVWGMTKRRVQSF